MTVNDKFDVKKVAIIGGGAAGIAGLYELLHTSKDGVSNVGAAEPEAPAFPEIILFERSDQLGGNWHYSKVSDPKFPDQTVLDGGTYNDPDSLDPILPSIPSKNELSGTSVESPLITRPVTKVRWNNSAAYLGLFSNIIAPLVRLPNSLKFYNHQAHEGRLIHPFSTAGEIQHDILKFVDENELKKHIRFNTSVEKVEKIGEKWELTLRKSDSNSGKDQWYKDTFDAVITANGHYSVPFVPFIENLNIYNKNHPNDLWHTKAVKEFNKFKDQNVLVIGSHASSVDIIRYLVPIAKSVTVSRRSAATEAQRSYGIEAIFEQPEISVKPKISRFVIDGEQNGGDLVEFLDGTTGKFDKIIFATGYHFHYPFLKDRNLVQLGKIADENSKYSLVKSLYLYAFAVPDPTFATIGSQQAPYLWATFEAQAAAIAGVWSNHSLLPSKEDQYNWLNKRNEEGVYHIYQVDTVRPNLVNLLVKLAPKGRNNPLDVSNVSEDLVKEGWTHTLRIYNHFKNKELTFDKIRELDTSKKATSFEPEEISFIANT